MTHIDVPLGTLKYLGIRPICKIKQVSTFLSTLKICTAYHSHWYWILRDAEIKVHKSGIRQGTPVWQAKVVSC